MDPVREAEHRRRLRWQCRRGMRELDLLLLDFLERGYEALAPEEKAAFERLLEYPDTLLQELLLFGRASADPAMTRVIDAVRHAAAR